MVNIQNKIDYYFYSSFSFHFIDRLHKCPQIVFLCACTFTIWLCSYSHEEVKCILLSLESRLDHVDKVNRNNYTETWKVVVLWGLLLCSQSHVNKPINLLDMWPTNCQICEWGHWLPGDQENVRPSKTNRRNLQTSYSKCQPSRSEAVK